MHVTLINPPFIFTPGSNIIFSQCLGILYIAAYLQKKGHSVTVIDALFEGKNNTVQLQDRIFKVGLSNKDIISRIPRHTDLIGLSVPFSHLASLAHSLIYEIKHNFSEKPVVMGGVYPSAQPCLAVQSEADYIILGEGEMVTCELLDYLTNSGSRPIPTGVISKRSPQSFDNNVPTYVHDLDNLPLPARNLLPFRQYAFRSQRNIRWYLTASIITSRGCPFDCEFCSVHHVCGYRWRQRSPKSILEEIDELVNNYQINNFEIEDDNFTFKKQRAIGILEGIVERNKKRHQKISWTAPNGLRIDTLDEELLNTIARSNCLSISLALEHGDEEVLKSMNKKLDLSKVLEIVKLLNKLKISSTIFVLFGYPGETRKNFKNAISFYIKLKKISPKIDFAFFVTQPYPGTKLFERCIKEGYIKADIFNDIHTIPRFSTDNAYLIKTPEFDDKELRWRRQILMKTLTPGVYLQEKLRNALPVRLIPHVRYLYHNLKRLKGKS